MSTLSYIGGLWRRAFQQQQVVPVLVIGNPPQETIWPTCGKAAWWIKQVTGWLSDCKTVDGRVTELDRVAANRVELARRYQLAADKCSADAHVLTMAANGELVRVYGTSFARVLVRK